MKKLLLNIIAIALTMALGGVSAVNAATCVAFTGFCDGLEVTVNSGKISGTWQNTDCAGTDIPIRGNIKGGKARIACNGTCLGGARWGWIAETSLDGTMDMYTDPGAVGAWSLWIDELAYTVTMGACTFNLFEGGTPSAQ